MLDARRNSLLRPIAAAVFTMVPLACSGGDPSPAPSSDSGLRPNVLVLLADDLRFDGLSITGNPWIETPHMDRIAREGVLFERAYVTTSRCCPARASFLTGRYAHVHGVLNNHPRQDFQAAHTTYAEHLQRAGYRTGYIGKWHIPAPGRGDDPRPGFDRWVSYEGPGNHFDQVFDVDGQTVASEGFQADVLTDQAIQFVREDRGEDPFLLVVGFKNPHVPMTPAPRHRGQLDGAAIELPVSATDPAESLPTFYRRLRESEDGRHAIGDTDRYVDDCRRYWELVLSIDDNVGRLLHELERSGELDRTVIVVTADNGQLLGEHGIQQKGVSYEPSIRIPLAVRYPALVPAGGRVRSAALNVDLFPTLLELCGVDAGVEVDGTSLVPQLRDPAAPGRASFLYVGPRFGGGAIEERAIVEERWKYVRFVAQDGTEEALFDRANDPDERRNVVRDPAHATELERLRAAYEKESARLGL